MDENSLTHYGVLGMKWGRRKSKASKGSNVKNSKKSKSTSKKTSSVKKKMKDVLSKVDKEKVKSIAKTTAILAGSVATAAILGQAIYDDTINRNFQRIGYYDDNGNKHLYKDTASYNVYGSYNSDLGSGTYESHNRYGTRADGSRVLLGKYTKRNRY